MTLVKRPASEKPNQNIDTIAESNLLLVKSVVEEPDYISTSCSRHVLYLKYIDGSPFYVFGEITDEDIVNIVCWGPLTERRLFECQ